MTITLQSLSFIKRSSIAITKCNSTQQFSYFFVFRTCTGPASAARMPSRVCPSLGGAPLGSKGLVSMELQSTWREAAPRCTLRATLCQRMSIRASTPSPVNTQLTRSAAGSSALARRDKVPSGPLKSTESWGFFFWNGGYDIERKVIYECTQVLIKHQTMCSTCQTPQKNVAV